MIEEKQILSGSSKYNDFKGQVGLDEHMPDKQKKSPLYICPDGHVIIGWRVGKYEYNSPIRIKIMHTPEENITSGQIKPDAKIYLKEIDITADEFINDLGRIEITMLRKGLQENFGEEFTFVHED